MDGNRPVVPVPSSFKPRSNASLASPQRGDTSSIPPVPPVPGNVQAHEDRTVHSPPFGDETYRPDLPTTTSNVHNPQPTTSNLDTSKTLPSLPHISAGPPLDMSHGARSDVPPLPHVTSIDREGIHQQERERPHPVVSESSQQASNTQGRFPHVQDIPAMSGSSSGPGPSQLASDDIDGFPPRSTSLHPERARVGTQEETTASDLYEHLRSVIDPDLTPEDFIARHLHRLTLQTQQQPVIPKELEGPFTTPQLEREREQMVRKIAREADERTVGSRLADNGADVFRRSGLGEKVGLGNTVDVHTKWMAPVVRVSLPEKPVQPLLICPGTYSANRKA
jgi:hypothetical protein